MSIFDPNALLDTTLDEPTLKRPPLPIGDYPAIIGEVVAIQWTSRDGSKTGYKWNVPLDVQITPDVQQALGIDQSFVRITHGVMLDMTAAGALDNSVGKNRGLRQYREALDLNKPGDTFSARKMVGQMVLVRISHVEYNGEPTEEIKGVAKVS